MNRDYVINRGHYLKRIFINIWASKNISGLVKVSVNSPAGLMKFFLNVEPWWNKQQFLGTVKNYQMKVTCIWSAGIV